MKRAIPDGDWPTNPRNPDSPTNPEKRKTGGGSGGSVSYGNGPKTSVTTFGDPLPIVYGPVKIKGRNVFMGSTVTQRQIWNYKPNGSGIDWQCHSNPVNLIVLAGSTTTAINLSADGSTYYSGVSKLTPGAYQIYFRNGNNAGQRRTITYTLGPVAGFSPPLTYAPAAGDFVTVGMPLMGNCAAVLIALCEAPIASVSRSKKGDAPLLAGTDYLGACDYLPTVVTAATASTWAPMEATGAGLAQGMTMAGTAQLRADQLALDEGKIPDIEFDILGSIVHPADVVVDLLTNTRHGVGLPTSSVITDVGSNGLASSSYRTYCTAMGWTSVSRVLDGQSSAGSYLDDLLEETNSTAIWSEGKLKIIPMGDATVGSYVPPVAVAAIGVDQLLGPVTVDRTPKSSVFNTFPVSFKSVAANYEEVTTQYSDAAHSAQHGIRRAGALGASWVNNEAHASALSAIKAQRSINIRNVYRFQLSHRWALLEPMDIVQLTEPKLGLSGTPVRIKEISEAEDGKLDLTAWEWPTGASSAITIPVQAYDGYATAGFIPQPASIAALAAQNTASNAATVDLVNVLADSVTTALIAPLAVGTAEIADAAVSAGKLSVDALQTINYAYSGAVNTAAERATAGAKMQSVGNALLVGPGGLYVGPMKIDEIQTAAMKAIGRSDSDAALVWYRGNSTGAPVVYDATNGYRVNCYSYGSAFVTANEMFRSLVELEIQPKLDTDNLDGLRYAKIEVWATSAAVTDTIHIPLCDRRYEHATASNVANKIRFRVDVALFGSTVGYHQAARPYHFSGYLRVILYSANGYSSPVDFYVGGITSGAARGSRVTSAAYQLPPGTNPPSGGGGGGGGACMDPGTPILIGPTTTAPLHALRVGDHAWTRPEAGGPLGFHRIDEVEDAFNLRQRVEMRDGRSFVCSINHLIRVHGIWRRADSLQLGEEMEGEPSGIVASVSYLGEGPVVRLSIPTARTYYGGDGLWQHNAIKL